MFLLSLGGVCNIWEGDIFISNDNFSFDFIGYNGRVDFLEGGKLYECIRLNETTVFQIGKSHFRNQGNTRNVDVLFLLPLFWIIVKLIEKWKYSCFKYYRCHND